MRGGPVCLGVCLAVNALGTSLARADDTDGGVPATDATAHGTSERHVSAHADRVMLAPTAETHPRGSLFASSYELLVLQVGYAFDDRLQAELGGVPFVPDEFAIGELTVKANLLRSRWLRVAALGSVAWATVRGDDDPDAEPDGRRQLVFGRVGGTAQVCFDLPCRSSLNLSTTAFAHAETDLLWPIGAAAGFIAHLNQDLALLVEYTGLFNAGDDVGVIPLPVFLIGYGLRIQAHTSWALDLGFVRALASDGARRMGHADLVDVLGVPAYAFTYRFET